MKSPELESGFIPPDKVWYHETRKINMGPYESVELNCGGAVTLQLGETLDRAIQRVSIPVIKKLIERESKTRERIRNDNTDQESSS